MKYNCKNCGYATENKSNYNKHIKTSSHINLLNSINQINEQKKFICYKCNKEFAHESSLSRHNNYRCIKLHEEIESLKKDFYEYKNRTMEEKDKELQQKETEYLRKQNQMLIDLIKSGKVGTTYNLSVKNYVQQNYPDAPALEGLKNYAQITFDDQDFVDTLVYNYNNNILHEYIGKFLIKHYSKEDPSEQSIWNSDTSRLTYIIKELLSDNNSCWNHDYKGVKTKIRIVNPLLRYIKKALNDYWMNNIDKFRTMEMLSLESMQSKFITIHKIKKDIDNGILASSVIKYMAPNFYMARNDITEINNNFIDN
ncbi:zinc finger C2H2-type protein [Fadolivirus algeromassiliense]|jgi:hypothetical protein|uniref:Zinc finger C2H2-type protein n=1 Tax=Fadolivirus FV1/VV64 TaxID=3070911 RepID=A0A7D3R292_9VIRU|nr:zinc finger C2H2-type protein [Fadolivirus algeromassiliense]QKF94318.1 zinc finger C2H2-type protein [Fadolivirus FV1/VV64]